MTRLFAVDEAVLPAVLPPGAAAVVGQSLTALSSWLQPGCWCRLLGFDDLDQLHALRAVVISRLEDPDHYRLEAEVGNFLIDHLGRIGLTAGVFLGDELIAYGTIGLPGPGDFNRGTQLGLPEAELLQVAHIASAMVHPDRRGRGLHHQLIQWRLDLAAALGRRHALTTVSPRNPRSWRHMTTRGAYPKRLLRSGDDVVRLLAHRDSEDSPVLDADTAELLPVAALATAAELFERGLWIWGYCRVDGVPHALCGRRRKDAAVAARAPLAAVG